MISLTSSLLFLSMISISRIFCKVQRGRAEQGESCQVFFSSSFANPKNKGFTSLIKLHADMERKAENLYLPLPKFMPVLCHEGKQFSAPFLSVSEQTLLEGL